MPTNKGGSHEAGSKIGQGDRLMVFVDDDDSMRESLMAEKLGADRWEAASIWRKACCRFAPQFLALGVTPKAISTVAKRMRRDRAKIQTAIERLFERPKFRP